MKIKTKILVACLPVVVSGALFAASTGERTARQQDTASNLSEVKASASKAPLYFEPNDGQTDSRVKFLSRGPGYTVFLTQDETVMRLKDTKNTDAVVRMKFVGANNAVSANGVDQLPGKSNYMIGDRSNWHMGVSQYGKVRFSDVYPGIDVLYQGEQQQLRYDMIVKPGASPSAIRMSFQGADKVSVDKDGNLVLAIRGKKLVHLAPYTYQDINGSRVQVASRYAVNNGQVGFELASYDTTKPVVIDPLVVFVSFLGGLLNDAVNGVAIYNPSAAVYLVGTTNSTNFPQVGASVAQTTLANVNDVFVTKLNFTGNTIAWSTYLGGTDQDYGNAITVDNTGNPVVVGQTYSSTFVGVAMPAGHGSNDAFAVKLASATGALTYATFLGGATNDIATGVVADGSGNVYVGGYSDSASFLGSNNNGSSDSFVVKLSSAGAVSASALYGGSGAEFARSIAITGSTIYLAGDTQSTNLAGISNNTTLSAAGGRNGFVAGFNTSLTQTYGTYLTVGAAADIIYGVAADSASRIYVTGSSANTTAPVGGGFQTTNNAAPQSAAAFTAIIDPSLSTLSNQIAYFTFYSAATGNASSVGNAIALDNTIALGSGKYSQIYITGSTTMVNPGANNTLPTVNAAVSSGGGVGGFTSTGSTNVGETQAFVARFNPNQVGTGYVAPALPQLNYAQFLGAAVSGASSTVGTSIAVDTSRTVFIGGSTNLIGGTAAAPTFATTNARTTGGTTGLINAGTGGTTDGFYASLFFNDILSNAAISQANPIATCQAAAGNGLCFDYAVSDAATATETFVISFSSGNTPGFTLPTSQNTAPGAIATAVNYAAQANNAANLAWLNLPTQDINPGVVRVSINRAIAAGLSEGVYTASFLVTALSTDNVSTVVNVTLIVHPALFLSGNAGATCAGTSCTGTVTDATAYVGNGAAFTQTYVYDIGIVNPGDPAPQFNNATTLDYVTTTPSNATLYVSASCSSAINWLGVQINGLPVNQPTPICTAAAPGGVVAPASVVLPAGLANDSSTLTTLLFTAMAKTAAASGNGIPTGSYSATVTVWATRAKNTVGYPGVLSQQTFTVNLFVFDSTQAIQLTPTPQNLSAGQSLPLTATVANSQAIGATYQQFGLPGVTNSLVAWSLVPFSTTENPAGAPNGVACVLPAGGQSQNGNALTTTGPSSTTTLLVGNPSVGPVTVYTCRPTVAPSYAANLGLVTLASITYTVPAATTSTKVGIFRQPNNGAVGNGFCPPGGSPCFVLNKKGDDSTVGDTGVAFNGINGGILATDVPVSGDWTGSGHAAVGIFRPSTNQWWLDTNNNGIFDGGDTAVFVYPGLAPSATDVPVTGDWRGIGKTCVGAFRSGFLWILDTNCDGVFQGPAAGTTYSGTDSVFGFGGIANDVPVVGNWDGLGKSEAGIVRGGFLWVTDAANATAASQASHVAGNVIGFGGIAGDVPVTGDWYGVGTTYFGIVRGGFLWALDGAAPSAPQASHYGFGSVFPYGGAAGDKPVTGKW